MLYYSKIRKKYGLGKLQNCKKIFGQYYTTEKISNLLVSQLNGPLQPSVLEISAGEGALVRAAYLRWEDAAFTIADIDKKNNLLLRSEFKGSHIHGDVLEKSTIERYKIKKNGYDLAICNPPYVKYPVTEGIFELLQSVGIGSYVTSTGSIAADILFLARNIELLKNDGEMAIILPDSFFTGHKYEKLRGWLLKTHKIKNIIQLPDTIFSSTGVRTHILVIKKGAKNNDSILLEKSNMNGEIIDSLKIPTDLCQYRMDYDFHSWNNKISNINNKECATFGEIGVEIRRGNNGNLFYKKRKISCIHSTDILYFNEHKEFENKSEIELYKGYICAEKNDILIPRVGLKCLDRGLFVANGTIPISDVIYRIRVADEYRIKAWESLVSVYGRLWRQHHAHGACARFLTLEDLKKFPIFLG